MTRRRLLTALAIVTAACAAALAWLTRRSAGGFASLRPASDAAAPEVADERVFAPETLAILLVMADVIVPRSGGSPAASEIDLVTRLEALIRRSPTAVKTYRERWPILVKAVRENVPFVDDRPEATELARQLRTYHRRFRRSRSGGQLGNAFEQLRRDVLRVYYASPEGQGFAGYPGPHHGPLPEPEPDA